jgi:hypothetical protein
MYLHLFTVRGLEPRLSHRMLHEAGCCRCKLAVLHAPTNSRSAQTECLGAQRVRCLGVGYCSVPHYTHRAHRKLVTGITCLLVVSINPFRATHVISRLKVLALKDSLYRA